MGRPLWAQVCSMTNFVLSHWIQHRILLDSGADRNAPRKQHLGYHRSIANMSLWASFVLILQGFFPFYFVVFQCSNLFFKGILTIPYTVNVYIHIDVWNGFNMLTTKLLSAFRRNTDIHCCKTNDFWQIYPSHATGVLLTSWISNHTHMNR